MYRNEQLANPDTILNNEFVHKPSVKNSAYQNLSLGFTTPNFALNSFDDEFNKSPHGKIVAATYEALKMGNQNPEVGWGQWGVNEAANMIGQSLNPMTWPLVAAGGLVTKPISWAVSKVAPEAMLSLARKPIAELMGENAAKYIPNYIGKKGEEQTLSMALFGRKYLEGFGIGAGVSLPQATIDNFNSETGIHDILGIAKSLGAGGIFGMALANVPFAWGLLKHNINRARGVPLETPISAAEADQLHESGIIDDDTHSLYKDIEASKKNPTEETKQKATDYLNSKGQPVDHANHTTQFEILNQEQMTNLQSATMDQLVGDYVPEDYRYHLSDFVSQVGIDQVRNKPELLDGVRGYVDYADEQLSEKNRSDILNKSDAIVDEHLNADHGELPFSQQEIYDAVKKYKSTEELPITIPEPVKKVIKQDERNFKSYIQSLESREKFNRITTESDFTEHTFYHGTGMLEDITQFDISKTAGTSLYGKGLYITDNKLTALGYAQTRGEQFGKILELKFKENPKLIDIDYKPSNDVFDIVNENAKKYLELELKKRNQTLGDLTQIIKKKIREKTANIEEFNELYSRIFTAINNDLKVRGYDGYLHTGGLIVGRGKKHNVVVLFGTEKQSPYKKLSQEYIDLSEEYRKKTVGYEKITGQDKVKLEEFRNKIKKLQDQYEQTRKPYILRQIKRLEDKISEIESHEIKLLTPKEELDAIRKELLPENKLIDDFQSQKSFNRLEELAEVWQPAKTLLDRINLEDGINKQVSYRDLAKKILEIADSNEGQLADLEKVKNYMQERVEPKINESAEPKTMEAETEKNHNVPTDAQEIIAETDRDIEKVDYEHSRKEYTAAKDKFEEFQKSEGIFKNLINCVLGSQK